MTLFSSAGSHRENANELAIFWAWPEIGIGEGSENISGNPQCRSAEVYIYIYISWNLFVLYFGASTLQSKALFKQNSRVIWVWIGTKKYQTKVMQLIHMSHVVWFDIRKKQNSAIMNFCATFYFCELRVGIFFWGVDLWGTSSYVVAETHGFSSISFKGPWFQRGRILMISVSFHIWATKKTLLLSIILVG